MFMQWEVYYHCHLTWVDPEKCWFAQKSDLIWKTLYSHPANELSGSENQFILNGATVAYCYLLTQYVCFCTNIITMS